MTFSLVSRKFLGVRNIALYSVQGVQLILKLIGSIIGDQFQIFGEKHDRHELFTMSGPDKDKGK